MTTAKETSSSDCAQPFHLKITANAAGPWAKITAAVSSTTTLLFLEVSS